MTSSGGPELIVGLVTPIGTNTGALSDNVCTALSDFDYTPVPIKLSAALPANSGPMGEREDERVRRLISAGDEFCRSHTSDGEEGDPAALARLAVREIRKARLQLFRQDGDDRAFEEIGSGRPRTAYVLHSLKRPAEVQLLREIYEDQFILIGSQGTLRQREENLMSRPLQGLSEEQKRNVARELIALDANEQDPVGQKVNDTYPQADFFLRNNDASRAIQLLFGEPIAPDVAEFAMYVARASGARSLAGSRKVGASIVVGDAVVASGYNDVPHGQTPDVLAGVDTSERMKRLNVLDTLQRLKDSSLLNVDKTNAMSDEELTDAAMSALKGGDLLGVIEYQRAVHAEAKAIDDATIRGVSPSGGTLFVTTYPCHLCYKHALSVRIKAVEYIEPYPKSRAVVMYPDGTEERLVPYAGVAPRRYMEVFDARPPFMSDASGKFIQEDRRVAKPLLRRMRDDDERNAQERLAVNGLKEEFRQ